jgi:single-strand DNA-binding protein
MELKCFGVGVATADSETRPVGQTTVSTANLAFNRSYKDKDGNWQKETSYIKAQIFGSKAEKFAQFVKKGTPICVEGYIKQDSWVGKDNEKKTVLVLNLTSFEIAQKLNGDKTVESTGSEKAAVSPPKNKQAKKSSPEPQPATVAVNETEDNDEIPF